MTRVKYDLVVSTGEYTDRNGNKKKKWLTIGKMFENDKGHFLTLDPHISLAGLPRSDRGSVMVSCFEPKDAGSAPSGGGQGSTRSAPFSSDFDDDIPFS